jgi:drug/metabolite transporter (DMT)-like permease
VVEGLPPFLSAAARFLVAGTVLFAWRRLRGDPAPKLGEWRVAAIIGAFLLIGGNGGVVWAEQRVPSGVVSLLVATAPLWMALLDLVLPGGRRPSVWVLLGVLVGLVGIVVLIGPQQFIGQTGEIDLLGAGVVTAAALSWSIGSLYSRQAGLPASPLLGTSMEMLAGGAGLFLLGTVTGEWGRLDLAAVPARSWAGLAYLIVLGTWVAFSAYTWLLRVAPTPLVATYAYVNPLVAVALGYLLAGEEISPRLFVAAGIIVGAVALITVLRGRNRAGPPQSPRQS